MTLIDLRSDTVTRPTAAMRQAMAEAEVGDDVYGEDPTVEALQREVAELLGKEAALFVSSGTLGNQLAISLLTRPGDEVIVGEGAHVAFYESGAAPALSGVQLAVAGQGGLFGPDDLAARVHAADAYYCPRSSLVCLENTHNRAGGKVFPQAEVLRVTARARALGLRLHLDGARLWNAAARSGLSVAELSAPFDTVSVCFSKGLGAPVGSALAGPRDLLVEARRTRKRWGGGMRQAGILAAGARHALAHHRARLSLDHDHAALLAELVRAAAAPLAPSTPETNIVQLDTGALAAALVADRAREHGVLVAASGPHTLRAVTHLDVTTDDIRAAAAALARAARACQERA